MEKQRIYLFDNLKFFLIITVVIGHFVDQAIKYPTFQSIYLFIYAFHMPLFIYISGVFHRNSKILEKVLIYTLLGYLLKIFIFFTKVATGSKPKFHLFSEDGVPWFMFALAAFCLISYVLRDIDKRFVLILALIFGCFVNYDSKIGDFLYLSRILVLFPFYHLGTMTKVDTLKNINHKKSNKLLGIPILAIWAIACLFLLDHIYEWRPMFTARNPFDSDYYPFGALYRIMTYTITAALNFALISLVPDKNIPFWTKFGARTMQVYFWHRPILFVLDGFGIPALMCTSAIGKAAYIGIAILLSFVLSAKIFAFPTEPILGLRDKLRVTNQN